MNWIRITGMDFGTPSESPESDDEGQIEVELLATGSILMTRSLFTVLHTATVCSGNE